MTTKEATKPDAAAIKAWAEDVRSRVADADTALARAATRLANAQRAVAEATTARLALNDEAALLGIPPYSPDDDAPARTERRDRKKLAADAIEALRQSGGMMTTREIAAAISEPTDKKSLTRLGDVMSASAKTEGINVAKAGTAVGVGAGWKYAEA